MLHALFYLLVVASLKSATASDAAEKGSAAFQYLEYLIALGSSSYASILGSCDLSSNGLLSQGFAVQHVLCDVPAVVETGICTEACKVLVDFQGVECVRQVAEAEAQISADFQSSPEPSDELRQLITKVNAYLANEYVAPEALLADEARVSYILESLADSSQATGVTAACEDDGVASE